MRTWQVASLSKKSTSGIFLALIGPHTFFPLVAVSTKQTAVSHASTESELVAMDTGMKKEALPMLDLWDLISNKAVPLAVFQDNTAALEIVKSGKNPNMRHIARQHGINLQFLHDHYLEKKHV